jgi:DNA (cytosine-5)-methyltransferase 1
VDRLLKSPAKQRGRDFGIILACLSQLGYSAEWRVVNAATYGAAQRRRRTFIFAYKDDTVYGNIMSRVAPYVVISQNGFMVQAFPITDSDELKETDLMQYKVEKNAKNIDKITDKDIENISDTFLFAFDKAGYMHKGKIYTCSIYEKETEPVLIKQILQSNVDEEYYITEDKKTKWVYLKGAKKIPRKTKEGHEYVFSEGPVAFPDPWDRPGRTMLTSESTLNRSTHVVTDPGTGRLRILTPVEAERLQGFGDDWTDSGMPKRMRYFCMGNALVVPMITCMGKVLDNIIQNEP